MANDTRNYWQESQQNQEFLINGTLTKDRQLIADKFNEYFTTIGSELTKDIPTVTDKPEDYLNGIYKNSMFLTPTTTDEIRIIIEKLKNCSPGWDGIKPDIIKQTYSSMIEPLCHIINLSFDKGYVPYELKIANVVPIFLKGDATLISNYRPISVLPVFSKIFEKLVYSRLTKYIDKHNIWSNYHFGFKKGYSIYMDIFTGLFLDFAKAFDTVNHDILLSKLNHYGIRGTVLQWFQSYLSSRKQTVRVSETNSELKNITCGVPQGSILGPLLFLIYIIDLSAVSQITFPIMYADDTNIFIRGKDLPKMEHNLNIEIQNISQWLKANKPSLNIKKTCTMTFSNIPSVRKRINNIYIDGTQIDTVSHAQFLGVIIDNKINWNEHIKYTCKKISKSVGIFWKIKNKVNKKTLINLYYTFIYPFIIYCNIVWGRAPKIYLSKIHILQKQIIRIISHAEFRSYYDNLSTE